MEDGTGEDVQLQPSDKPTSTRVGRGSTRMAKLALRKKDKRKVVFDKHRLMPIGPTRKDKTNWSSYLGTLGRKVPSILICSWKKVPDTTKELVWEAILEIFNIFLADGENEIEFFDIAVKLQMKFKRKWLTYVGERWASFKTRLTTKYIYGKRELQPPYVKDFKYFDKVIWDAFVALRLTSEEKAKREKGKEVQSHNKCPQTTSRGGYELLSEKMIEEKREERQKASQDPLAIIPPPSPPPRYAQWKRACIKASKEYTTPEVKNIADRIDSLVEQQSSGSFTAIGRNDILAVAIGKPDHPCRVRGVGKGYTTSTYFGRQQYCPSGMVSRDEFNHTIAEMDKKLKMILSSQAFSGGGEPLTPIGNSGRGSNFSQVNPDPDLCDEDNEACELYVADPHRRLVAYGRIHDLGSTVHNMKLKDDQVRVTVSRVVVGDAEVPFPTEELTKVGKASGHFILWHRSLVEKVGRKGISQKELFKKPESQPTPSDVLKNLWVAAGDINQPKLVCIEPGVVSVMKVNVHICKEDIIGLLVTRKISISAMQFYNKYLYTILRESERIDKYGFITPMNIQHGSSELQTRIGDGDFECFLAPIYDTHWQLMVLCPKDNYVAWFCCKQDTPTTDISSKIVTAFNTYQLMNGTHSRKFKKLKWVYPKCCRQGGDECCGLFVMRHMLEIIKLDIVDSFEKVFNMKEPYSNDDIDVVRRGWAECFLEAIA